MAMINGNAGYVFFDAAPQLVLADADDALQDGLPHQQERRQRLHPGVASKCLQRSIYMQLDQLFIDQSMRSIIQISVP